MALHGLGKVTVGVPNVDDTISYYTDFGLAHRGAGVFATVNGGEQLEIVHAPTRRLVELTVAADDPDDIAAITARLDRLGLAPEHDGTSVRTVEPVTGTIVRVAVRPRIVIDPAVPATLYNGPGRIDRWGRAPFLTRTDPVRPRKLGHAVIGSTDLETTMKFFTDGLGFKVSDYMGDKAAFLRCSVEHHNVLVMAAPVNFMHHTSWQVDDIDEVGR
ncbi:MAG: dioxygenase, partial [Rhodococcus sp. (in: high G+C Gram-positive bacteria)]